jgi:hypothetical protein
MNRDRRGLSGQEVDFNHCRHLAGKQQLKGCFGGRGGRRPGRETGPELFRLSFHRFLFLNWYFFTAALCALMVVEN